MMHCSIFTDSVPSARKDLAGNTPLSGCQSRRQPSNAATACRAAVRSKPWSDDTMKVVAPNAMKVRASSAPETNRQAGLPAARAAWITASVAACVRGAPGSRSAVADEHGVDALHGQDVVDVVHAEDSGVRRA